MYDSLYSSVPSDTMYLIASMIFTSASRLEVRMMNIDKQSNGSDCGVLAIAFAFDLCSGSDPCKAKFGHKNIRKHLLMCLESCKFSRFPVLHDSYKSATTKSPETQVVDLHCTCRMPEKSGDDMALCESCDIWYHRHCMDIPDEVFDESEVDWKCRICCQVKVSVWYYCTCNQCTVWSAKCGYHPGLPSVATIPACPVW